MCLFMCLCLMGQATRLQNISARGCIYPGRNKEGQKLGKFLERGNEISDRMEETKKDRNIWIR